MGMKIKNYTIDLGNPVDRILTFIGVVGWIAGVVIANGFWSTLFSVILGPFWAWYLCVEKLLEAAGIV
jgi:hypothetical protein